MVKGNSNGRITNSFTKGSSKKVKWMEWGSLRTLMEFSMEISNKGSSKAKLSRLSITVTSIQESLLTLK